MAKVRVPRKNVTPGELTTVLGRRLGAGYKVESNGNGRVLVRKNPVQYASISIKDSPGASVFRVRAGGPPLLGVVTNWGTARRVADVIRRSPEFRSLLPRGHQDKVIEDVPAGTAVNLPDGRPDVG
jgi:hypothetical protein